MPFTLVVMASLLTVYGAPAQAAYPRPGSTELVSLNDGGRGGSDESDFPSISANGRYVAFASLSANLSKVDKPEASKEQAAKGVKEPDWDVFVHDRVTHRTRRVSVTSRGNEAKWGHSTTPAISANGRFVAFASTATNLVPGDTNGVQDIFVHDRVTGATTRASVFSGGKQSPLASSSLAISGDGRFVAFENAADGLVAGDTNDGVYSTDVFIRDRIKKETTRVPHMNNSTPNQEIAQVEGGCRDAAEDVEEVLDEADDVWELPDSDGAKLCSLGVAAGRPALSADGRYVAYYSHRGVPGLGRTDLLVFDRKRHTIDLASAAPHGAPATGSPNFQWSRPSISADGRFVAFESAASNLVPADTNGLPAETHTSHDREDIFVHDRRNHTTERVSVSSTGVEASLPSARATISPDGRFVAFFSMEEDLAEPAEGGNWAYYLHDRVTRVTEKISMRNDGTPAHIAPSTWSAPVVSRGGRFVAFGHTDYELDPRDGNAVFGMDVYVRDRGAPVGLVGGLRLLKKEKALGVFGQATFSGLAVRRVSDPVADGPEAGSVPGAEITGASIVYRREQEDLLLRWEIAGFPPLGEDVPSLEYVGSFRVGRIRYEVVASRDSSALYRCAPVCARVGLLEASFGSTGPEVLVGIPLGALRISEGTHLTRLKMSTRSAASVGRGTEGVPAPEASLPLTTWDDVALSPLTVPRARVQLAISWAGSGWKNRRANIVHDEFSGVVPTSAGSPRTYRVRAQACLGSVCGERVIRKVTL
jgi:Tol biopolymer transport system component